LLGLLKRFRDLLLVAALLVVPLAVFFAHAKRPTERSKLDRAVVSLTAPVERGVAWVVGSALEGWRGYVSLRGVRERAVELSRRVNELELGRLEMERLEKENDRLRKLLGFAEREGDLELVGARVVGVRLDPKGLQLVTVDRGADDGLQRMMPVVAPEGVVGRVHAVTRHTADVLLLVDRNSSVAARVERSRARANVRGLGDPYTCRLDYALRSDDLVEDDVLVTSGTDGVFPRGLPVGKVRNLKKQGQGLYQKADVAPAVDVTKLEEVLVVVGGGDRRADPEPEPAAPVPSAAQGAKPAAPVPSAAQAAKPAVPVPSAPQPAKPAAAAPSAPQPAKRAAPVPSAPQAANPASAAAGEVP
jgi:rod shape-determining protein MreC